MPLSNFQPFKLIRTKKETEEIGRANIQTLRKLLEVKNRKDLSFLLKDCTSYLEESSQYGSYLFSIISTFWIYVPPEKIEEIEQLSQQDKELLLELVKKIYPPKDYSPEINELKFRVKTDVTASKNQESDMVIAKQKSVKERAEVKWFTMNNPLVWLIFSVILIIISYFIYKVLK